MPQGSQPDQGPERDDTHALVDGNIWLVKSERGWVTKSGHQHDLPSSPKRVRFYSASEAKKLGF